MHIACSSMFPAASCAFPLFLFCQAFPQRPLQRACVPTSPGSSPPLLRDVQAIRRCSPLYPMSSRTSFIVQPKAKHIEHIEGGAELLCGQAWQAVPEIFSPFIFVFRLQIHLSRLGCSSNSRSPQSKGRVRKIRNPLSFFCVRLLTIIVSGFRMLDRGIGVPLALLSLAG